MDFVSVYQAYAASISTSTTKRMMAPNDFMEVLQHAFPHIGLERRGNQVLVHALKLKPAEPKVAPSTALEGTDAMAVDAEVSAGPSVEESGNLGASPAPSPYVGGPPEVPMVPGPPTPIPTTPAHHAPRPLLPPPENAEALQAKKQQDRAQLVALLERIDDVRGIPLSTLLILRNLARHPTTRSVLRGTERDLVNLLLIPKFSRISGIILSELSVDL